MNTNMQTVRILVAVCVGVAMLLPAPHPSYGETNLKIWHEPPECGVVESPIRIAANITSTTPLKDARIYFKQQGTTLFYFVQMTQEEGSTYTGILPAPMKKVKLVEYLILGVDRDETIVKSPLFYVPMYDASECPSPPNINQSDTIVVYAEQTMSPEIGFFGENVRWSVSGYSGKPYLNVATEMHVQSRTVMPPVRENRSSNPQESHLNKKTVIGVGVGLGALGVVGAIIAGSGNKNESKEIWSIAVDDPAKDVVAELNKAPEIQTACGSIVTNQLYVTNNRTEPLTIGTIDYEIVLTQDKPTGSCEGGRIGSFAPNWVAMVQPGETALIREWSNEINPCSDCPYLMAKCRWNSRYLVHTSAGSAVAEATFAVEGNLCATPSAKSVDNGTPIKGDIEP